MELEQSDQEQIEALQKWWRENWMSLIGGLILGLGGILGWQYYGEAKQENAAAASVTYEQLKAQLATGKLEQAQASLTGMQQEFGDSPYVVQGHLALAQAQAEKDDWAAAEVTLRQALELSDDAAIEGLVRLRLARSLWAQGNAEAALAELDAGGDNAYAPLYQELRGDIAAAQGDAETARTAYEQALASDVEYIDRGGVERKLSALN